MNEILSCIKLIKMYAWEESFAAHIDDIRKHERHFLMIAGYLQSITTSMIPLVPVFASMTTFIIAAYSGRNLSPTDVSMIRIEHIMRR